VTKITLMAKKNIILILFLSALLRVENAYSQFQLAQPPVILKGEQVHIINPLLEKSDVSNILEIDKRKSMPMTLASIQYADKMFINVRHPYTVTSDNVYILNATYSMNKVGLRLFGDNAKMNIDGLYLTTNPDNTIAFHLDPIWDRIVYSQKSGNWIKSYGDHTGEYAFLNPSGMVVDIRDTLYVTDTGHNKVVKLYYNPSTGFLNYISSFAIPGMLYPIDIAFDQTGTLSNPANPQNDRVWIADIVAGKIVAMKRDGTVYQTITQYTVGPTTYMLSSPQKIQMQEIGGRLAFIDKNRMAFVTVLPPSPAVTTATAIYSTEFNNNASDLTCIGQDINNEWWVGDQKLKMYHHFTVDGKYIASYDASNTNNGQFSSPVTASKSPYYFNGTTPYRSQYVFTSDLWGTSTGERAFFPGADVLNVNNQPSTPGITFNYRLTNQCTYTSRVLDYNHAGSSVKDFNPSNQAGTAGDHNDYVAYSDLQDGIYYWEGTALPYYNSNYGSDSLTSPIVASGAKFITPPRLMNPSNGTTNTGITPTFTWHTIPGVSSYTLHIYNSSLTDDRTVTVANASPWVSYTPNTNLNYGQSYSWEVKATGASVTSPTTKWNFSTRPLLTVSISGPSCVNAGSSGTWTANVSGSVGPVNYSWCWMTVGPCIPIGTNSSITFTPSVSGTLKCTVSDISLSSTASKSITYGCSPPPSCPFVFTWDGDRFREDNNILPQSEYPQNNGVDVTDFYRLLKPLRVNNGKYALQIREFENELSYLDQFKLLAIDYPAGTKIDVDANSGEVYQYVTPYSLRRALLRGSDITSLLAAMDTNVINVNSGDTLNLSLSYLIPSSMISSGKNNERTISSVGGGSETAASSPPKEQKTAYIVNDRAPATVTGPPATVNLAFRQRKTLIFKPMSLDSLSSWKIIWSQKAAVDYVNFGLNITPLSYTLRELPLASARHSTNGNALSKLTSQDSVYEILTPGQTIELRYNSLPPPADGTVRSFILVSRGRYEKISDSTFVPQSLNPTNTPDVVNFSLNANYPNPFNPTTNIQFELPQDGHVMLAVFNTLGQEVTRLVDQNLERGLHNISWDARGNASGIYFCRFVVTDNSNKIVHQETQKMLLMR